MKILCILLVFGLSSGLALGPVSAQNSGVVGMKVIPGLVNVSPPDQVSDQGAMMVHLDYRTEVGLGIEAGLGRIPASKRDRLALLGINYEGGFFEPPLYLSGGYQYFEISRFIFRGLRAAFRSESHLTPALKMELGVGIVPIMDAEYRGRVYGGSGFDMKGTLGFSPGEWTIKAGMMIMSFTASGLNGNADATFGGLIFGVDYAF